MGVLCTRMGCLPDDPDHAAFVKMNHWNTIRACVDAVYDMEQAYYFTGRLYHDLPWHIRWSPSLSQAQRLDPYAIFMPGIFASFKNVGIEVPPDVAANWTGGVPASKWFNHLDEAEGHACSAVLALRLGLRDTVNANFSEIIQHIALAAKLLQKARAGYFAMEKLVKENTRVRTRIESMLQQEAGFVTLNLANGAISDVATGEKQLEAEPKALEESDTIAARALGDAAPSTEKDPETSEDRSAASYILSCGLPAVVPDAPQMRMLAMLPLQDTSRILLQGWLDSLPEVSRDLLAGSLSISEFLEKQWRQFQLTCDDSWDECQDGEEEEEEDSPSTLVKNWGLPSMDDGRVLIARPDFLSPAEQRIFEVRMESENRFRGIH
ncbi:MAG: hypothetical protein M1820_002460 [Bogoriella megaspora]|nr:MAG: hypothetical protein M1820_002460 [Bogoriella megaspora]